MTETLESARRWSGYVCPDCRFVFRVPRDHDGMGIVCPSCRRLLKIPSSSDLTPPLLAPLRRTAPEAPAADGEENKKIKKRRRGKKVGENHSWERDHGSSQSGRSERRQMRMFLIGGTILLGLIVGGVIYSMNGGRKAAEINRLATPRMAVPGAFASTTAAAAWAPRSDLVFVEDAEPLARKFLSATTVEEILPMVRAAATAEPRMRKFYQDNGIKPVGMSQFNTGGQVATLGSLRSVGVTTGDFDDKVLVFEESPEGLKIDWESWVGWSEIPWAEFLATKPQVAKIFRVTLSPVVYYNFGFSDEEKWVSYRLESPDHEHSIYGYAEKGSLLEQQIRPSPDVKSTALTLSLKFSDYSTSNDQVQIERLITEGWAEGAAK